MRPIHSPLLLLKNVRGVLKSNYCLSRVTAFDSIASGIPPASNAKVIEFLDLLEAPLLITACS
jgi:hypothetical protein